MPLHYLLLARQFVDRPSHIEHILLQSLDLILVLPVLFAKLGNVIIALRLRLQLLIEDHHRGLESVIFNLEVSDLGRIAWLQHGSPRENALETHVGLARLDLCRRPYIAAAAPLHLGKWMRRLVEPRRLALDLIEV